MFKVLFLLLFFIVGSSLTDAKVLTKIEEMGIFSGRVSRINDSASLIRVRVKFGNMRFLNKQDRVEFFNDGAQNRRCLAIVMGKSNSYLLLRIPEFRNCRTKVGFSTGGHLKFYSRDLINNLKVAREVISILLKKRLAIDSRFKVARKDLDGYITKVEAVNSRYSILRDKLELEWQDELTALEEDKSTTLRNYKDLEIRLGEIDHKLQQYSIDEDNVDLDRWALDPKLFYRK